MRILLVGVAISVFLPLIYSNVAGNIFPTDTQPNDSATQVKSESHPVYDSEGEAIDACAPVSTDVESVDSSKGEYVPVNEEECFAGVDGHHITFKENESAVNPTYDQVINFLKSDTTDQIEYDDNKFTCADYAELVQHNAEDAGLQCGWVYIQFIDGTLHACNVFNTTDKGLLFTDSTSFDKVVNLQKGAPYIPVALSKLLGYNKGVEVTSLGTVSSYEIFW